MKQSKKTLEATQKRNLYETDRDYRFGFSVPETAVFKSKKGLSEEIVREISRLKNEPKWMLDFRLASFETFLKKKIPSWGPDLSKIHFDEITYFLRATKEQKKSWEDLPKEIKDTYDRIGVPKAERDFLAGVSAQYESEVVYESIQEKLKNSGVLFCDMDTAIKQYPDIVRQQFGTLIQAGDNMFSALNSAVWSGGSFVYIPRGIKLSLPLQAYFRINAESFGQFERTLIIAEEGSDVHYIEGCTAPIYRTQSLHAAVVEVFVKKNAHVRYTTVQNWSKNIYNLVTKRARAEENSFMEWIDCNIGSGVTMKYPSVQLIGKKARGEMLSIAVAGHKQIQDTGGKMFHLAPETSSRIISKSISRDGGINSYRGKVTISPQAKKSSSFVSCSALLLDEKSISNTYPTIQSFSPDSSVEHEAIAEKIGEEKLFYLKIRGLNEDDARSMIVNGFIEPITKEIPLEYSVELNRLIRLEMDGSVG